MYQQDDCDIRNERAKQKLEPLHNVMLRSARMPGGIITPKQWLAIDKFADESTLYGSIRLTTRQTFSVSRRVEAEYQIDAPNAKQHWNWFNSDKGWRKPKCFCVMTNPVESIHQEAYEWAKKISEHLLPKTRAYAEIWLDGEKLETNGWWAYPR